MTLNVSALRVFALIREGRWWQRGKRHKVYTLQLEPFGVHGYRVRARTKCGLTIDDPELTDQLDGVACRRCER